MIFTPIEKAAFERVKERARQFAAELHGETSGQVIQALVACGIKPENISVNPAYRQLGISGGMAVVSPDSEINPAEFRGKHLLTGERVPRNVTLTTYAREVAFRQGLVALETRTQQGTCVGFSYLKALFCQLEISRFLVAEHSALGMNDPSQIRFEREFQASTLQTIQGLLSRKGIRHDLANLWPPDRESYLPPFPSPVVLDLPIRAHDYHILANGSQALANSHPLIDRLSSRFHGKFRGHVLSLGTGEGDEIFGLIKSGAPQRITALDSSSLSTRNLRRHGERGLFSVPVEVIQTDLSGVSLPTGCFDHVLSVNVFDFIPPEHQPDFLKKVAESLALHGKATIAVLSTRSTDFQLNQGTVERVDSRRWRFILSREPRVEEIKRFMSVEDLRASARRGGLLDDKTLKVVFSEESVDLPYKRIRQHYVLIQIERKTPLVIAESPNRTEQAWDLSESSPPPQTKGSSVHQGRPAIHRWGRLASGRGALQRSPAVRVFSRI